MKYMIILIALVVCFTIIFNIVSVLNKDTITVTVTGKERINNKDDGKYLIFTDKEVFENTDSLWYLKWNSSDVYAKIVVGKTYRFKVYGFRIQFFSMYRNIVEVEEIVGK